MKIKTNMNSVKSFRLEINVYVYEMDKDRNVCMESAYLKCVPI